MLMSCRTMIMSAAALGCTLSLHAQTPTSAQSNRAKPDEITLTGCVERADQVDAPVTPGTTVDSLSFVLMKATRGTAEDSRTTGTSGTKAAPETGSMYRLDADVSKLNPHVGHKVEVTGALDASATTATSVDPQTAANAPRVRVNAIKMISETCGR